MSNASSSLFSRIHFPRSNAPVLPFHLNDSRLRHEESEYDLDELEPRPEDSILFSAGNQADQSAFFPASSIRPVDKPLPPQPRYSSPSVMTYPPDRKDRDPYYSYAYPGSARHHQAQQSRVLFTGPPPPIATSVLLYRDVEDQGAGSVLQLPPQLPGTDQQRYKDAQGSIQLPTSSVLFDRSASSPGGVRRSGKIKSYDADSTWTVLQRRQRALQREIQNYLDLQSAGLSAGLGRGPPLDNHKGTSSGPSSDAGSSTPTAESMYGAGAGSAGGGRSRLPTDRSTASGAVIPVRQPRPKKTGLRGARAGLSRSIAMLADLKAEEDAALTAALNARKRALVHLRKLSGRRADIADELHTLETGDDEPLTRELKTLQTSLADTTQQITELESQLAVLRNRKCQLETRMTDVQSQREAGLSGYRGALKEVDAQLATVLRRPPVQPLDVEALGGTPEGQPGEERGATGGDEFVRMRPERRTAEMAKLWWKNEVALLERRQTEVDTERVALEEGGAVWLEAVQLVSDFEASLRRQMKEEVEDDGTGDGSSKGKSRVLTPEERMQAQLGKMDDVLEGLGQHLDKAEAKGWNLLICAIGAELEAFQEAQQMLRGALQAAGFDVPKLKDGNDGNDDQHNGGSDSNGHVDNNNNEDEDVSETPRLARSASEALAARVGGSSPFKATAVSMFMEKTFSERDSHDGIRFIDDKPDSSDGQSDDHPVSESEDNDVPPGLLVSTHEPTDSGRVRGSRLKDKEPNRGPDDDHGHDRDDSSENEVPIEFLAERPASES